MESNYAKITIGTSDLSVIEKLRKFIETIEAKDLSVRAEYSHDTWEEEDLNTATSTKTLLKD